MGPLPVARTVEGGLRRIHGGGGPQPAQNGAETGAQRRAARSSGAHRRHCRERRALHGRYGGRFRHAVMVLCVGKLVDPLPQARTTVDPLPVGDFLNGPDRENSRAKTLNIESQG